MLQVIESLPYLVQIIGHYDFYDNNVQFPQFAAKLYYVFYYWSACLIYQKTDKEETGIREAHHLHRRDIHTHAYVSCIKKNISIQ